MEEDWPFDDPPNAATITTTRIVYAGHPVLLVAHWADDGSWTFMDGEPFVSRDALVIGLANMVAQDPTLRELSDLPLGWEAWRMAPGQPWQRRRAPRDA